MLYRFSIGQVVKLVYTPVLGTGASACRFKSDLAHQQVLHSVLHYVQLVANKVNSLAVLNENLQFGSLRKYRYPIYTYTSANNLGLYYSFFKVLIIAQVQVVMQQVQQIQRNITQVQLIKGECSHYV